jgi:hypothetical protein
MNGLDAHTIRFRRGAFLVALLSGSTLFAPVTAVETSPPESCKLHPRKVVNPGCDATLTGDVRDPGLTSPDLRPNVRDVAVRPMYIFDESTLTYTQSPPHLWFDTHAENHGAVPFDLMVEDLDVQATSSTSQCISWTATYVCRERAIVGGFVWHDEHKHFHYQDFAKYELRRLAADGRPDYSSAGLVGASEKVSFCLVDSEPLALPPSPTAYPPVCTATRQGVSPGWTDIYSNDLPGQQLSLDGLTDGRYALVITIDPPGRLYDSDRSNNRIEATVEIGGNLTTATVVERAWR